jgi:hypothetical protein
MPDDLMSLKVGDVVTVRHDDGNEADYEVRQAPWLLGHGTPVLSLKGISGCYALDRVVKVVKRRDGKCDETRRLLIEMRKYVVFHNLLIGECVAWRKLKEMYGITNEGLDWKE